MRVNVNPATILALLAENDDLRARIGMLEPQAELLRVLSGEHIIAERDRLRAEVEALRRERDALAKVAKQFLEATDDLLTDDPDMPSHSRTVADHEASMEAMRALLARPSAADQGGEAGQ